MKSGSFLSATPECYGASPEWKRISNIYELENITKLKKTTCSMHIYIYIYSNDFLKTLDEKHSVPKNPIKCRCFFFWGGGRGTVMR